MSPSGSTSRLPASATVPTVSPAASAGTMPAAVSLPAAWITAAASTVGTNRPGAPPRPHPPEHPRQFGQPKALAAEALVDVQPEPALRRQLAPEGGPGIGYGVEERSGHVGWAVALRPAARRLAQRLVLVADPDRHRSSWSPSNARAPARAVDHASACARILGAVTPTSGFARRLRRCRGGDEHARGA